MVVKNYVKILLVKNKRNQRDGERKLDIGPGAKKTGGIECSQILTRAPSELLISFSLPSSFLFHFRYYFLIPPQWQIPDFARRNLRRLREIISITGVTTFLSQSMATKKVRSSHFLSPLHVRFRMPATDRSSGEHTTELEEFYSGSPSLQEQGADHGESTQGGRRQDHRTRRQTGSYSGRNECPGDEETCHRD